MAKAPERATLRAIAGTALILLGFSSAAAEDRPWPPPGTSYYGDRDVPDISGVWMGQATGVPGASEASTNSGRTSDGRPPAYWSPWPLPYTPTYQKMYEERVETAKKGKQLGDIGSKCLPFGVPFMLVLKVFPEEIEQTPGRITMYGWSTFPITIWTDGRDHPKNLTPSYNGHSIGHWVGDILYVDTVGIRGETPLDGMYNPHSDKLRIKWSIQKVAGDVLHFTVNLYDDEAFTEPVTMTNIWHRQTSSGWAMLDDASCFDGTTAVKESTPPDFIKF